MLHDGTQEALLEKPGGAITKLQFNDGTSLDVKENEIVLFVGPNNAGKSQALKDIYALSNEKIESSVVVRDITLTKRAAPTIPFLEEITTMKDEGSYQRFAGMNGECYSHSLNGFAEEYGYGAMRFLFVAYLSTLDRLTICEPPRPVSRNEPKTHPIHYVMFESTYRKWLSENFRKAFGKSLMLHWRFGEVIPLCIGEPVQLEADYPDEDARGEAYGEILNTYPQVQNQGDGIKSFVGILLYLMLDHFCTFLIDEPESFLHPPQAKIMGQIIGNTLSERQQAFLSTHSEEIVKGLLETCPERVKIVRVTREGDANKFSTLDNKALGEIWQDPLLKYSNILLSLFHKTVVLCESDADCKMYSLVEGQLKREAGHYSETLFIHCGGKQRMGKIATALRALEIDIRLIADMDLLNQEQVFRKTTEACGVAWETIEHDYGILEKNVYSGQEKIGRTTAKETINRILDGDKSEWLSAKEIGEITKAVKKKSKWAMLKMGGKSRLPHGDAAAAFGRMDGVLKEHGVYLVPVGELECFIPEVGGHGPEWVNAVLDAHPDLSDPIYDEIRKFIGNMGL